MLIFACPCEQKRIMENTNVFGTVVFGEITVSANERLTPLSPAVAQAAMVSTEGIHDFQLKCSECKKNIKVRDLVARLICPFTGLEATKLITHIQGYKLPQPVAVHESVDISAIARRDANDFINISAELDRLLHRI